MLLIPWSRMEPENQQLHNTSSTSVKHAWQFSTSLLWRHNGLDVAEIINLTIVYSTVHSGADQRKHQRFTSLAFVRGIHRWPVNSPHKWSVMRKMFPFDAVIMITVVVNEVFLIFKSGVIVELTKYWIALLDGIYPLLSLSIKPSPEQTWMSTLFNLVQSN